MVAGLHGTEGTQYPTSAGSVWTYNINTPTAAAQTVYPIRHVNTSAPTPTPSSQEDDKEEPPFDAGRGRRRDARLTDLMMCYADVPRKVRHVDPPVPRQRCGLPPQTAAHWSRTHEVRP